MGFDDRNMIQDAQLDDSLYKNTSGSNVDLDEVEKATEENQEKPMDIDFEAQARNDGFGETLDDFGKIMISFLTFVTSTLTVFHI